MKRWCLPDPRGLYLNAIDVSSTFTTKLFESVVYFCLTSSCSVHLKLASSLTPWKPLSLCWYLQLGKSIAFFQISPNFGISSVLDAAAHSHLGTSLAFGHQSLLVFPFLVISLFSASSSSARQFFKDRSGHLFFFTWYPLLR